MPCANNLMKAFLFAVLQSHFISYLSKIDHAVRRVDVDQALSRSGKQSLGRSTRFHTPSLEALLNST